MYLKRWVKATAIRMLRTFAQVLIASLVGMQLFEEVDWRIALSKTGLATLICMLMCLRNNLPELSD